jgi:hypothetical protein
MCIRRDALGHLPVRFPPSALQKTGYVKGPLDYSGFRSGAAFKEKCQWLLAFTASQNFDGIISKFQPHGICFHLKT